MRETWFVENFGDFPPLWSILWRLTITISMEPCGAWKEVGVVAGVVNIVHWHCYFAGCGSCQRRQVFSFSNVVGAFHADGQQPPFAQSAMFSLFFFFFALRILLFLGCTPTSRNVVAVLYLPCPAGPPSAGGGRAEQLCCSWRPLLCWDLVFCLPQSLPLFVVRLRLSSSLSICLWVIWTMTGDCLDPAQPGLDSMSVWLWRLVCYLYW